MIRLPLPLVLASRSPRRRELLLGIVPEFEVCAPDVDEAALTCDDPWCTADAVATAKAKAVARHRPGSLVIGGDTIVAVREESGAYRQLGKPLSREEAREMLGRLSGGVHEVITGVCLATPQGTESFCETTAVAFRRLSDDEIAAYVASGEPMDKAGAYAIQGGAAGFVDRIDGSLSNVIGLPVEALAVRLEEYARMAG